MQLHKRYSEFEALRQELASTFPRAGSSLPLLPPKSVFCECDFLVFLLLLLEIGRRELMEVVDRFRPAFLEKRRAGLEYFLKYDFLLFMWA